MCTPGLILLTQYFPLNEREQRNANGAIARKVSRYCCLRGLREEVCSWGLETLSMKAPQYPEALQLASGQASQAVITFFSLKYEVLT